ncbi:MAG: AMP-binding protein [Parachlamydia sp.]|nr:AMP-binding protein [Parachlamydia sp.]
MKNFIAWALLYFMRMILWFRYRVTIKGLENLNEKTLSKSGGVLFLPNHPTVFVDPTLVTVAVWKKFPIRPMIVEYMYYTPIVHGIMKFLNALPVPNFVNSSNSLKKKKADAVMETVIQGLKTKENFLIYPAGRIKHQGKEIIGASGVHRIVQSAPEANVVLVRTTGLWGSSFSRALTGQTPPMFTMMWQGFKKTLKNFIFFTPRREVTIELVPAPADFPYQASRLEFNRYLERWYNRPDGLTNQMGDEPGESLYLVSYSLWGKDFPSISMAEKKERMQFNKIPEDVEAKVKQKLSEMAQIPSSEIRNEMGLSTDLGLDSLDNAELLAFMDDSFDVSGVPVGELTTVNRLMGIAAKQVAFGEQVEEEGADLSKWRSPSYLHEKVIFPEGATIPEVFLNVSRQKKKLPACGDLHAGVLQFSSARMRVLLLADYIRRLPGEKIGLLLPSSVAAYLTIIATQLAGKIPVMINWTVGPRHLEQVRSLSGVQTVLSSWAFLDRLENVDLKGIEDLIILLEDARREFTLGDKLKAFIRSKLPTSKLLKTFNIEKKSASEPAVILFTSGTENMPKGVPLTHENILSNQRDAVDAIQFHQDDILLGILPPFHSYGFTASGLLPLLIGLRVAYYADPTDGKGLAREIEKWGATILCGAPAFLKGILKNAKSDQLKTLKLCVTGAEKAPQELFQMVEKLENCHLIEGYGITECSPILTANRVGEKRIGVGRSMPHVELCVVNIDTHEPLPQGERGLILARGPNIFSGYLNSGIASPFLTVNQKTWYVTGDLGFIDVHGNLILSGRLKRFIKIGGEMISLAAIEEALGQTMGEKMAASEEGPSLAVCAKEEAGEKTKIFVFTRFATSLEELNRALRQAGFSNLVKIYKTKELPEIPLMGAGKINYRQLETQLNEEKAEV